MKRFKSKTAMGVMVLVTLMTLGFSRTAPAAALQVQNAVSNFQNALRALDNASEAQRNGNGGSTGQSFTSAFNNASAAYQAIQDGYDAAVKASESLVSDLEISDPAALGVSARENPEVKAAEKLVAEWEAALKEANRVLDERNGQSGDSNSNNNNNNTNTSNNTQASNNSQDEEEDDLDDLDDGPDGGEEAGMPNPEGDARVTGVHSNRFAGKPTFLTHRSLVINPNPDGSDGSSGHVNPFQGTPTLNPKASAIDPSPEGGSKLGRISGSAPVIDLRAPVINPNPDSDAKPSGKITGTIPQIDPRAPKASLNLNSNLRNLSGQVQKSQSAR